MTVVMTFLMIVLVLAALAAWVAERRGRNFWVYFVFCLVVPVAAFVAVPYLLIFGRRERTA